MGKQLRIQGTARPGIPEALEEASDDLLSRRRDKRRITKEQNDKVKTAEWKVLTLMQEHGIKQHAVKDSETEEVLSFDLEAVLRIRKTGEVGDGDEGESDELDSGPGEPQIHPGLIAQAEKAQADANVEETADGDVAVPEKSVPKKSKRGGKKKGK